MADKPTPPPEALLLKRVRKARRLSIPKAASAAGISASRWSQIENGYESKEGTPIPVTAPAGTLAHMATALGIGRDQLASVGRADALDVFEEIQNSTSVKVAGPAASSTLRPSPGSVETESATLDAEENAHLTGEAAVLSHFERLVALSKEVEADKIAEQNRLLEEQNRLLEERNRLLEEARRLEENGGNRRGA